MGCVSNPRSGKEDVVKMEKYKQLIAFLFQRSGKEKVNDNDIYMALSYELGWFTPAQSKDFIKYCLDKGLLRREENLYVPDFEYAGMEIPLGFRVDGGELEIHQESRKGGVTSPIIEELEKKGVGRDEIKKLAEQEGIIPEVAVLVAARERGIDVSPFLRDVWDVIKNM